MIIKSSTFLASNTDYKKCPEAIFPEYAFIGRSNVGKSTLINLLTNNKKLAKISNKPGKTKLINHFLINEKWYMVDLPGYGYAKDSIKSRETWAKSTNKYILNRENLFSLFVLIDSRIPPQELDIQFLKWLGVNQVPFMIVFTKIDKLSPKKLNDNLTFYKEELLKEWEFLPEIFLTSSITNSGKEEILDFIEKLNKQFKKSVI